MRRIIFGALTAALVAALAVPAYAHVTVQPNEAVAGTFSRFSVRVPNERDDASTIEVSVEFPPLAFLSFQPLDGWDRKTTTVTFDEPIDAFGNEITEGVGTVTWSGGKVKPHEFVEFGFSALVPGEETTLEFKATQTYDSGEVVEWTGAADSDTPAARVTLYDIGAGEGEGQLGVLNRLADGATDHEAMADDTEESEDKDTLPLILGGTGSLLGLFALAIALKGRKA